MPTTNPRVNVTLSVSLDNLVSRLAGYQRVSKSQVLRELLEEAEPALERVAALMDAASRASAGMRQDLARRLERDLELAEDSSAVVLARFGRTADLVSQAEAIQGRRPARRGRVAETSEQQPGRVAPVRSGRKSNPPSSNRGVKSTKEGAGRATKTGSPTGRRGQKK